MKQLSRLAALTLSLSSSLRTMTEKADAVVLGSYKKALDAEKGDSPNADSQKRDCSF